MLVNQWHMEGIEHQWCARYGQLPRSVEFPEGINPIGDMNLREGLFERYYNYLHRELASKNSKSSPSTYADWIIAEIEQLDGPVDIVGHDWGCLLTQRVVSVRPDLFRSWVCGGGPVDTEYVWHDTAQAWQTPEVGEAVMDGILGLAPAAHGANRTGRVFTGDGVGGSSDFLMAALHRAGFASAPTSTHRDDGLVLRDAYISIAVRCATSVTERSCAIASPISR